MAVVDSHVHFWDPAHLQYPWLEAVPTLHRAFLPEGYADATAQAGISKMVFVECGCSPRQALDEVRWVSQLAVRERRLRGIVARTALERGEAVREDIAALAHYPLVKGVRRNFEDEVDADFCLRPDFVAGVRELERFDFSLDVCVRHQQLPAVIRLVRQCGNVRFVLDHCGKPDICHRLLDPWREHIASLAKSPNVFCKLSGLLTEANRQQWKPADFQPYVDHVLESFGSDRIMIGGDWPVINLGGTYAGWCEVLRFCLGTLDQQLLIKLYEKNAESFYRLDG